MTDMEAMIYAAKFAQVYTNSNWGEAGEKAAECVEGWRWSKNTNFADGSVEHDIYYEAQKYETATYRPGGYLTK